MGKQKLVHCFAPMTSTVLTHVDYVEFEFTREARGECPKCHKAGRKTIYEHDKQTLANLAREMARLHERLWKLDSKALLYCESCRNWYRPNSIWMIDELEGIEKQFSTMEYDTYSISKEERKIQLAKSQMRDYFKQHQAEFWAQFDQFVLTHWKACVNELSAEEFRFYYESAGDCMCEKCMEELRGEGRRRISDLELLRRKTFGQIKTDEEKLKFWHQIHETMMDFHIGAVDLWDFEEDTRHYGKLRTAFIYFYLPIPKDLEEIRRPYMEKCLYALRDTSTAIRHALHLVEERDRLAKQVQSLNSELSKEKAKSADMQTKLSQRQTSEQKKSDSTGSSRSVQDRKKIEDLKQLIAELRRALSEMPEPQAPEQPSDLEHDGPLVQLVDNTLERLRGKTVAIIGGRLAHHVDKKAYPCTVATHEGWQMDDDMLRLIKQSDVVIVLTRFIRHGVMWDVKEQCILHEKPAFFERSTNVNVLLHRVASELDRKCAV